METTMGVKFNRNIKTPEEREAFNKWAINVQASSLYSEYDDDNYDVRQKLKFKEEYEHALFLQEKEEELAKENAMRESEHRRRHGIPEPDHSTDQTYSVANTIKNYFYKILN